MSRADVDTPDFVDSHTAADRINPEVTAQWAVAAAFGLAWVCTLTWLGWKALAWASGKAAP